VQNDKKVKGKKLTYKRVLMKLATMLRITKWPQHCHLKMKMKIRKDFVNDKEHKEVHPKPSTLLCKTIKQLQNNHKKKECEITKK